MPSPDPDDPGSHEQVDEEVEAAWSAAFTWLEAADQALDDGHGLTSLLLPHPQAGRVSVETGLVDADFVYAVVAAVERAGEEVDGLYVGLVAQEPSTRWIGLAGFFLPVCPICDRGGVARATDRMLDLLTRSGFEEIPGSAVPEGLRPGPGWFDRERLQTVARRSTAPLRTTWSPWPPAAQGNLPTAFLVRVGPVVTSLCGLVLCASTQEALGLPELIGEPPAAWTWTTGDLGWFLLTTRHRPRGPREVLPGRGASHDWWRSDKPFVEEHPRRLHRGQLPQQAPNADKSDRPRFWALGGAGVATRAELHTLLHTPA